MKKVLLLLIFFLGLLPFLDHGELKIGNSVYAQSFGDEYGGWEDGGWQDGDGWDGNWGMNDGDPWDSYGNDFYNTVTDLLEEIYTYGLASFDDGYTKYTFDENGVTNNVTYYTWEQLDNDHSLVPNYIWDVIGALEEYHEREEIYAADIKADYINHNGDPNQLANYLRQYYNSSLYDFRVVANVEVEVYDGVKGKYYKIWPNNPFPDFLPDPAMPYSGHVLGDAYYGVNEKDWGDVDFNWPDYIYTPGTPYDPASIDWMYWLYGVGGDWDSEPTTPPLNEIIGLLKDPLEKDAEFNNCRNYLTPTGVVIKLPPGAKVFTVQGIDMDVYPNGALYGFKLPDGTEYVATFTQMMGLITGFPKFLGFFKLSPTGSITGERYTSYEYPDPSEFTDKKIRVVRMKKVVENGQCILVRDIVEFDNSNSDNAVYPGRDEINDAIRFDDPVPGTTSEQTNISCPPGNEPPGNNWNLDQYIKNRGVSLVNFLKNNLHSTAKIILYDCATGQAKYAVTKDGANSIPAGSQSSAMAQYNSGNFSEDIAITGCIDNGKWNYDFKFKNNLFTNPHPKVQPHLQEVLNEIKAQAEDEIKKLLKVGTASLEERYELGNNTRFRKKAMELFPAALAILDVGKHIVKEAKMPDWIWDAGNRSLPTVAPAGTNEAYLNSAFNLPPLIGGATDQLVDEATGILQLTQAGYQFIRHPKQTVQGIWNSVKSINGETMKKLLVEASGVANYQAGGDLASHQAGKHGIKFAMTVILPVKNLTKGVDVVKKTGDDLGDIQKFIPDGPDNQTVTDILKHSVENNQVVKNIDNQKLITKNTVQNEVRFNAIDKSGEVFDSKAVNNMDDISEDVLKKADASDLAEAAEDASVYNQMKTQPLQFKDGKDFERNITQDPTHTSKIEAATGLDLTGFDKASQIQIRMSDGSYIVADNVYYKPIPNTTKFEVVINESKLSSSAPFTENQLKFLNELQNGNNIFTIRTSKLANSGTPVPKGATLEVSGFVKTVSDGTSGISNYTVTQIP